MPKSIKVRIKVIPFINVRLVKNTTNMKATNVSTTIKWFITSTKPFLIDYVVGDFMSILSIAILVHLSIIPSSILIDKFLW